MCGECMVRKGGQESDRAGLRPATLLGPRLHGDDIKRWSLGFDGSVRSEPVAAKAVWVWQWSRQKACPHEGRDGNPWFIDC
jgi:hypothetical protein